MERRPECAASPCFRRRRSFRRSRERATRRRCSSACSRPTGNLSPLRHGCRAVAEREPDEHLDVRVVLRNRQCLFRIAGLDRRRHALRISRLRLVPVLRDPERHRAMEPLLQILLELRHGRERHVRIPHLLRRRQPFAEGHGWCAERRSAAPWSAQRAVRRLPVRTDALAVANGLSRPRADVSPIATCEPGCRP